MTGGLRSNGEACAAMVLSVGVYDDVIHAGAAVGVQGRTCSADGLQGLGQRWSNKFDPTVVGL